jgi:hypothetical protein
MKFVEEIVGRVFRAADLGKLGAKSLDLRFIQQRNSGKVTMLVEEVYLLFSKPRRVPCFSVVRERDEVTDELVSDRKIPQHIVRYSRAAI